MSTRLMLLALAVPSLAGSGPAGQGLLAGATVVLYSGLPGDVESERAYEDQLQRLLRAAARPGARPARLFVLADSPERVRLPEGLTAEVRPGTRQAFVALGRDLAASPGPLVVVLWGHGGAQGTRPVFHVRGPRVDVADVAAFAQAAGTRPSRWILYFRGSGAFAEALGGSAREVLSSEQAVAFRSDPIGMDLLARALAERPALSFTDLAEHMGRETASWYEKQGLARTEEPTLWSEGSPRRLAAVVPPPAEPGEAAPAPPSPPPAEAATGPDWAGLTPADAAAFPDLDAVVLRRTHVYTLGESPALVEEVDQFVQVLTEEGKARGDVQVSYAPPDERLVFLDCEVRRPDGSFARLDPEQMQAASAPSAPPGHPARGQHAFSLPGITPGAILRVHYRREWRRFPLPHVFVDVPLAADVPTLDARVDVRTGLATPLHHAMREAPAMAPEVRETPFARIHSWRFGRVEPVAAEALAPPGRGPRLLVSTFPDWGSFAEWYRRLILLADQVTPEIEARGRRSGARQGRRAREGEGALRVRHPAALRGGAAGRQLAPAARGGQRAAQPLRRLQGQGEPLQHAAQDAGDRRPPGAGAALRRGAGGGAGPGLQPRHLAGARGRRMALGRYHRRVRTVRPAAAGRPGTARPGDRRAGSAAHHAASAAAGRARHPPARSRAARGARPSTLEVHARGFSDYALRQVARQSAGQGATSPLLAGELRPWAGRFGLRAQRHTAVAALDEDFTWRGEGTWSGLSSDAADGRTALRAPFWLPEEWDVALHARRTPLFLNQGYPLELEERLHLELPPGARVLALPPPAAGIEPPLAWRVEWSAPPEGGLLAELRAELADGELSGAQTRAFQEQLRALTDALAQAAVYAAGGSTR